MLQTAFNYNTFFTLSPGCAWFVVYIILCNFVDDVHFIFQEKKVLVFINVLNSLFVYSTHIIQVVTAINPLKLQ